MNNYLKFNSPSKCFEESVLLGNGFLGAAVYGGTSVERYSMNEATLWSGYPTHASNPNGKEAIKEAQKLVSRGEYAKSTEVIENNFTGPYSQVYLPLCSIIIENNIAEYDEYERGLDMQNGTSFVKYKKDNAYVKRESFISNPHRLMAIKISQKNVQVTKIYIISELQHSVNTNENELILRGTAPAFMHPEGRRYPTSEHHPEYSEDDRKKGMKYKGILRVDCDGEIRYNGDCLEFINSSEIIIYFTALTSFNVYNKHPYLNGAEIEESCKNIISNAVLMGYDKLKTAHINDFSALYNRTKFSLFEYTDLTTDELLKAHNSNALYEQLFNIGKYLTISGSRKGGQPMNLQGIWNEKVNPPWNSNYTININTQMNYLPTLALNLSECFEPYIILARELFESGKRTAKEWYGVNGSISHHNTDIWRMTNPVGSKCTGSHISSFFNTSLGWILWGLVEKFKITQDMHFLKETLYPMLSECAETFINLFVEDENGKLYLSPATSPENMFFLEDDTKCALAVHSAINNAICRDILKSASECAEILGDNTSAERYNTYFKSVFPYLISSDGRIMEWDKEYKEVEINHRHVSHLYGLHPAREISPCKAPELTKAAKTSLNVRGDDGTGWCIAWKANMWARLFDGNRAIKLIDNQLTYVFASDAHGISGGTYPNLLCAHPPFQIDGNFGATSAILEMLIQCNDNNLYLLPALPDKWQNGEIKGIKIHGDSTVDLKWKNGKVCDLKILPKQNAQKYNIIYCTDKTK